MQRTAHIDISSRGEHFPYMAGVRLSLYGTFLIWQVSDRFYAQLSVKDLEKDDHVSVARAVSGPL